MTEQVVQLESTNWLVSTCNISLCRSQLLSHLRTYATRLILHMWTLNLTIYECILKLLLSYVLSSMVVVNICNKSMIYVYTYDKLLQQILLQGCFYRQVFTEVIQVQFFVNPLLFWIAVRQVTLGLGLHNQCIYVSL